MAQTRSVNTNRTNISRSNTYGGTHSNIYVYGNTARKLDVQRQLEQEPRKQLSNETRKNREKAHHMSLGYVVFLVAALCCTGIVLVNYLQIQSKVTRAAEVVSTKEQELNNLKLSNDETLNRINSSIDVEEIKRIAIGELGMTYASEGQIITYTSEGNDYLRRVAGD